MRKAPTAGQHSGKKRQHQVHYRDLIGRGAAVGQRTLQHSPHPAPFEVSHHRHQPAPATHRFAGVTQLQTGRRTPKNATLLLHRSVPPSVLVESRKTQLYQRAQNDAQLLFSNNRVFRV